MSSLDTVLQRNWVVPTPLVLTGDNRLVLPRGAVFDVSLATLVTGGTSFTFPNDNFFLGLNATVNPNTLGSTVTRSFGAGNSSCTVTEGTNQSVIGSTTSTVGGTSRNLISASNNSSIVNTTGTGNNSNNAIVACSNENIQQTGTGNISNNFIAATQNCNFAPEGTPGNREARLNVILGCNFGVFTHGDVSGMICCETGRFNNTTSTSARRCVLIGCSATNIEQNCNGTIILGCNNSRARAANNCLLAGGTSIVDAFNNVFAFNATATASSQAIFGTRMDVTGGNLMVTNGYTRSATGFLGNQRTVTANTTLLASDHHVIMDNLGAALTITVPSAPTMSASFPIGTTKEFLISCRENFSTCLITSASNLGTLGLTSYRFLRCFETVRLLFVNVSPSPYYCLTTPYEREVVVTAPTNSFGVSPPKSDAAQLPTSTNEATHVALTTTSFVTFTALGATYNPSIATLTSGFVFLNLRGEYKIEYEIQVVTSTGGGSWLLRSDIAYTDSGNSLLDSYQANSGPNTGGTRLIRGTTNWFWWDPSFSTRYITVRLSQDSGSLFNASASISSVKIRVNCKA